MRVDYQSYQGAQANVPKETITTTEESVRYISSVTNPMAAYGGYDGYNEETSAAIISNMLRTRGRAVTGQDYFDIISQNLLLHFFLLLHFQLRINHEP